MYLVQRYWGRTLPNLRTVPSCLMNNNSLKGQPKKKFDCLVLGSVAQYIYG